MLEAVYGIDHIVFSRSPSYITGSVVTKIYVDAEFAHILLHAGSPCFVFIESWYDVSGIVGCI